MQYRFDLNRSWRQRLIACLELPYSKGHQFAALGIHCTHDHMLTAVKSDAGVVVSASQHIVLHPLTALRRFAQVAVAGWISHVSRVNKNAKVACGRPPEGCWTSRDVQRKPRVYGFSKTPGTLGPPNVIEAPEAPL